MRKTNPAIRIIPKNIPCIEKKLLCATFLEAVICFYKDSDNMLAFEKWCAEKGEIAHGSKNGCYAAREVP